MVYDQAGAGPIFCEPRRRGGINFGADSEEARWAADAANQAFRQDACRQEAYRQEKADREAEDGAEMLRMMKMWSFQQQAPAVASAGGAGTGTGAEAGVDQEMVAGQQLH